MKVTVLTVGSRGDIVPYVALAEGLKSAGLSVTVATHASFSSLIRETGVAFAPIAGDPVSMLRSEAGMRWLTAGRNPALFAKGLAELMTPIMRNVAEDGLRACCDADALVTSFLGFIAGRHIGEALRIPLVLAPYHPVAPTKAFPSPLMCIASGGRTTNYLSHWLAGFLLWQRIRPLVNQVRRDVFGLPALARTGALRDVRRAKWPIIHGYSEAVVPRPDDWDRNITVTGYWHARSAAFSPSKELATFLADGEPPVYVGFGSMGLTAPDLDTEKIVRALAIAGRRGILLSPLGDPSGAELPSSVLALDFCPHDWLLPRVSVAVHHGGAGTTAAALRAGTPSIVVPFFADQPFWAWCVERLGAGAAPIAYRQLTAERLAVALERTAKDAGVRQGAQHVSIRLRDEDGVERAVETITRLLCQGAAYGRPG